MTYTDKMGALGGGQGGKAVLEEGIQRGDIKQVGDLYFSRTE